METLTPVVRQVLDLVWETPWSLVFLFLYLANYFSRAVKRPVIRCGCRRFKKFLLQHCPVVNDRFWVTPWCSDGRLHTTLTYYSKSLIPDIKYTRREVLPMADGGLVGLDWLETKQSHNNPKMATILFLPGLNGDSQICYVKSLVILVQRMGYRSVVFNFRGKGGIKLCVRILFCLSLQTKKTFCPTDYGDLGEVVRHIKSQMPNSPILAVGTSLGGIMLGHYVSDLEENTGLEAAVLISGVFDLERGLQNVEQKPLNIRFSRFLCSDLVSYLKMYENMVKNSDVDFEYVCKSHVLSEFVSRYNVPTSGLRSLQEFYRSSYLNDKLRKCKIPLLAISADDDPFQPGSSLPRVSDIDGAPVAVVVTKRGGHLGFQDGFNVFKPSWADRLLCQFCRSILECNDLNHHSTVFHG